jgi:uncharacterized protein YjiK
METIEQFNLPTVSYNSFQVPRVFLQNCGVWEGVAQRVNTAGQLMDEHLVRVTIQIEGVNYVQTNTVRINTPREVTAHYYGIFQGGTLVFPLTDEVYTLGGEKATAFSGIAWAVTDDLIVYRGSRSLQGCKTHYNELIALHPTNSLQDSTAKRRIRTTQLYEEGVYKLVTMIDETRVG